MPHGWRISRLRDVHLVRDTPDEIAYHACISVAFIVEPIKIARRAAAQPARRTLTSARPGYHCSNSGRSVNTPQIVMLSQLRFAEAGRPTVRRSLAGHAGRLSSASLNMR